MVAEARLAPFVVEDGFLRRTDRKRYIKPDGVVFWEAFKPRPAELTLSFTYQDHQLRDENGLRQYQLHNELKNPSEKKGDLLGICKLTFHDLTGLLSPPLPPRFEEDPNDERYGRLHCLTGLPVSQEQMELMAELASQHREAGLPFHFVPKEKRIH